MTTPALDTDSWNAVRLESEAALSPELVEWITKCRQDEHPEGHLVAILHRVQTHFGHLGQPQLDAVAQLLGVPTSRVTGVATFYHHFRLVPRGRHAIQCCMGTACYVRGGDRVAERFKDELGIDFGQVTVDGQFSLDSAACLGTCGLAPVVTVGEQVLAQVTPDQIPTLLAKARREPDES